MGSLIRDGSLVLGAASVVMLGQHLWRKYQELNQNKTLASTATLPLPVTNTKSMDKNHELHCFDEENEPTSDAIDLGNDEFRRIRKAETVLRKRISQVILVLEASCDLFNHQAVLRTAECLGFQHVWIVHPAFFKEERNGRKIARQSFEWLSIRHFQTTTQCIAALRAEGCDIWVTDLSQGAKNLETCELELPQRVAVVIGRESDGASQEMLDAADHRIFFPMYGFADSFNLNVASALVLQYLLYKYPQIRGSMSEIERASLRSEWYKKLCKTNEEYELCMNQIPEPFRDVRRPKAHRDGWMPKKILKRLQHREQEIRSASTN